MVRHVLYTVIGRPKKVLGVYMGICLRTFGSWKKCIWKGAYSRRCKTLVIGIDVTVLQANLCFNWKRRLKVFNYYHSIRGRIAL